MSEITAGIQRANDALSTLVRDITSPTDTHRRYEPVTSTLEWDMTTGTVTSRYEPVITDDDDDDLLHTLTAVGGRSITISKGAR